MSARVSTMMTNGLGKVVAAVAATTFLAAACSSPAKTLATSASPRPYASLPTALPGLPSQPPSPLPKGVGSEIRVLSGGAPAAAVPAYGSVWVMDHRGTMLYRIDPATGKIEASVDAGEGACFPPQIGFGRIFVSGCEGGDTVVVDPEKEQVVATSQCGGWMAFAAGSIWSPGGGGILRCDPATYKTTATIKHAGSFAGLAYDAGSIWAANMSDATVERIDPATNKVVATISAGARALGDVDENLLVAFGSVWVSSDYDTRIFRIDPSTKAVRVYHPDVRSLGDFNTRTLVAGMGSLWIRTSLAAVTRFDPRTMKPVQTYPTDTWDGGGGEIAVAGGSLWIPNPEEDTIWRESVRRT